MWEVSGECGQIKEFRELYGEPDILNMIKAARIRWLGHVVTMQDRMVPKTTMGRATWWKKNKGKDQVAG